MKTFLKGICLLALLAIAVWCFVGKTSCKYNAQYAGVTKKITWDYVNFRSAPRFDDNVRVVLHTGAPVTLTGRTKDTSFDDISLWYEVQTAAGDIGWVIADSIGMGSF